MASTFTPNKDFELQATGENVGTWGIKLDSTISQIDLSFGGFYVATGLTGGNVNVTQAQALNVRHDLQGTLTSDLTYNLPATGGYYIISNSTSGAFNTVVTMGNGLGGVCFVSQGFTVTVFANPTTNNVDFVASNALGTTPVPIGQGGTGATSAASALAALGGVALTAAVQVVHPVIIGSSGNYTVPAGLLYAEVVTIGGGGGGAGSSAPPGGQASSGGGGGSGGMTRGIYTVTTLGGPGAVIAVSIGAPGVGGNVGGPGGNGGTTLFGAGGSISGANGGLGGGSAGPATPPFTGGGGAGGSIGSGASGTLLAAGGNPGSPALAFTIQNMLGGNGGGCSYTGGGGGYGQANTNGGGATAIGAGGGGASSWASNGGRLGGAGGQGAVYIIEYRSS